MLRTAYGFKGPTVAKTLRRLLDIEGVEIEEEIAVRRALALFEKGSADFSDYVLLESARQADALPVRTFDRRFAREREVEIMGK